MTMMQGLWAVPYLMDVNRLSQQEAANMLTLWAVGLIVGCTLWGYVADRVLKTRRGVICSGAVIYAMLWLLLAVKPELSGNVLHLVMFSGGFLASTWIPAYALLKDSVPSAVVATAMGMLNLFFWFGGAFYQQMSGLLLGAFQKQAGHIPSVGYQTLFWLSFASVALSVILAGCSREQRPPALNPAPPRGLLET